MKRGTLIKQAIPGGDTTIRLGSIMPAPRFSEEDIKEEMEVVEERGERWEKLVKALEAVSNKYIRFEVNEISQASSAEIYLRARVEERAIKIDIDVEKEKIKSVEKELESYGGRWYVAHRGREVQAEHWNKLRAALAWLEEEI